MSDDGSKGDIEELDPGPVDNEPGAGVAALPDGGPNPHRAGPMPWSLSPRRAHGLVRPAAVALVAVLVLAGVLNGLPNSPKVAPQSPGKGAAIPSAAVPSAAVPEPSLPRSTPTAIVEASTPGSPLTRAAFSAPGAASGWTGFSWAAVPDGSLMQAIRSNDSYFDSVRWAGGYAAIAGTMEANGGANVALLLSRDGETWKQVTAVPNPAFVAPAPHGLVVVSLDQLGETIWTSADGVEWRDAGPPTGIGFIGEVAGTSAGLVAIGSNGGKAMAQIFATVVFSSDGVSWTPVTLKAGGNLEQLWVQSNGSRFFVMGGYAGGTASSQSNQSGMWWSDNGRTWTRSSWSGYRSGYVSTIDFASGGMISSTSGYGSGPLEMEVSNDGGNTWRKDANMGPFGAVDLNLDPNSEAAGYVHSNGSIFLAVGHESSAWTSPDGWTWTQIEWAPPEWGPDYDFIALPRGVMIGHRGQCGGGAYCGTTYYGSAR